jgi:hypothetical protein
VYGTAVLVHGRDPTKFQHQVDCVVFLLEYVRANHFGSLEGFGTLLMEEAEWIAMAHI